MQIDVIVTGHDIEIILVETEGNLPLGRPRRRWKDMPNIKMNFKIRDVRLWTERSSHGLL
jgi:hypothetical protein